ncbi:CalY family protein [Lactonifactor longoviformis]|uniref:TasA family protein n=1 Tax=Lactonifactor longoviformis TaxID=341220 RepID=UPI0021091F53|nr:TasA family protein [Lactonifactor longoviformis]MCQ4669930.1 CalY family protein [Lactonifactor longoviformis]
MMNRKKLTAVVASVALVAVLGIGGTLMYFTDKDSRTNVITMGKVDGTLTEDGEVVREEDGTIGIDYDNIMPGDVLDKVPVVTIAEDSEDAYLRIKLVVEGKDQSGADLADKYIKDIVDALDIDDTVWVEGAENYYYYNGPTAGVLKATESATFFEHVTIPAKNWDNTMANAKFTIKLQAELIQADNFAANLGTSVDGKINNWNGITADDIDSYTAPVTP